MRKRWLAAMLGSLLLVTPASAENQLRFTKPIEFAPLETEELVAAQLDSDIYAATRAGYPDLRVLKGSEEEAAFLVRKTTTKVGRKVKQVWTAEDISLHPLDDGGLEITFRIDLEKHPEQPQGIRLITPLRNFEHRVRIESSADGKIWQPLVEDGLIFDYSQFMDVRNLSIELPTSQGKERSWIRITIENVTQEQQSQLLELSRNLSGDEETSRTERQTIKRQPFRIDRIELWHDEMRLDTVRNKRVVYPLTVERIEQDSEAHETLVYLKSRREPLTRLTLDTADRNFSRSARVEVRRDISEKESWQAIGTANLTHLDFRSLKRKSLSINFPEHRETEYRLVIENRDSPPLGVKNVTARGNAYEVVFLAAPKVDYRLAYDSKTLDPPNFDTVALSASLKEGFAPVDATLGEAVESDVAPEPGEPLLKRILNDGPVLTAIIAVLVVLLAVGLYRATRNLDGVGEP
ncbi:DUF3999 family protein [Bythopirellula polymerisocia]|uniref:F5/8 type C domain protein n=1 Tax=Bythopirellula polymerisocia TaxID=2528003 RepID=A0A5C6D3S2_9BACT|nr:DUF3999 family protein [Bythopirellula polymerisocia]TWU30431.1 hypothetical protein Pla144_12170 [Bythopirellula polymerisocia]